MWVCIVTATSAGMLLSPLEGSHPSFLIFFFFFFPVMQIIHNNGKLKNIPFGLTGNFCTYNPRIRTPGGAALMATTDGEGLSSAGRTSTAGGWNRAEAQPWARFQRPPSGRPSAPRGLAPALTSRQEKPSSANLRHGSVYLCFVPLFLLRKLQSGGPPRPGAALRGGTKMAPGAAKMAPGPSLSGAGAALPAGGAWSRGVTSGPACGAGSVIGRGREERAAWRESGREELAGRR